MPELPEVETVCRTLSPLIQGRSIIRVDVFERRLRIPIDKKFAARLNGRSLLGIERKGKFILIRLDGGSIWIVHLGMSGRLIYLREKRARDKHDHIVVCLENGDQIRYHDPRRFGLSIVMPEEELGLWRPLRNLGVDPFDSGFNANYLFSAMRKSKRRIRDFLIDPGVVAGLGNIYANEILFQVGLRPTRRAWKVSHQIAEGISKVTPRLLEEAIRWRGTSFSDYRDGEDREGEFQNRLQVYNRDGKDCLVCSSRIKKVRVGNRGAFYCPRCQK